MTQIHAEPAKSTRAATAKISQTVRSTRTSLSPRQVHFMETYISTGEGLFLADEYSITNLDNSIDTDDLPFTTTINSEESQEQVMLMPTETTINLGSSSPQ